MNITLTEWKRRRAATLQAQAERSKHQAEADAFVGEINGGMVGRRAEAHPTPEPDPNWNDAA